MGDETKKLVIGGVIFPGFELLDIFGPLELFGLLTDHCDIVMLGDKPGSVASAQGPAAVIDTALSEIDSVDVLLVPGGVGVRGIIDDADCLAQLRRLSAQAKFTASVCTGSALLAKAGLLDGRRATSNKLSFDWVASHGPKVLWERHARWVEDDNIFTASGVSAGMDMALGLIDRIWGQEATKQAATEAEYLWNQDKDNDPFALI